MDDEILRMYVDEIYAVYDNDYNGYLDMRELHVFVNRLYADLNDPRRFTQQ